MAELVTNSSLGSGVSFSTSEMKIGLGNKILIDAGAVNTIVLGAWNRLMACASTDIYVGTGAEITMANAVSVTLGESWNYLGDNQIIATDSYSISGLRQVLLTGGINPLEKERRLTERQKINRVLIAVVTSFIFTIGLSLVSIQYPPFQTIWDENNNEILKPIQEGESLYIILGEALGMLCLFFAQYILARKMSENNRIENPVSSLSFDANGIKAEVYKNPNDRQQLDLPKVQNTDDTENTPIISRNRKDEKDFSSAIFQLIPETDLGPEIETDMETYLKNPTINLNIQYNPAQSQQSLNNLSYSNGITILPSTVLIHSKLNTSPKEACNEKNSIILNCHESSSCVSFINQEAKNVDMIFVSDATTLIHRNYGRAIDISSFTETKQDSKLLIPDINQNNHSNLHLSNNMASLSVSGGDSGIFVNENRTTFRVNQEDLITCNSVSVNINNKFLRYRNIYILGEMMEKEELKNSADLDFSIASLPLPHIVNLHTDDLDTFTQKIHTKAEVRIKEITNRVKRLSKQKVNDNTIIAQYNLQEIDNGPQ